MIDSTKRGWLPILVGLTTFAIAACGSEDPTAPRLDPDAPIQTNAAAYSMVRTGVGTEAEIGFTFTNVSDEIIYFPNCGGLIRVVVEQEVDGVWTPVAGSSYADCLSPVIEVAPGATASSEVRVAQYDPGSNFCCGFAEGAEPPGTYRLRATNAVRDYDENQFPFGSPVESQFLVSNRFELR